MQEKLIEILSRATAWMTAGEIADAGKWRSASNVGVALQQMERANGQVERRKAPVKKMSNGMPATEWKLTDKEIIDPNETKMGRKPKFPPLEDAPVVRKSRTTEMPTDKECCNAAKVVATTAGAEVSQLNQTIEALRDDVRRQVKRADDAEKEKLEWLLLATEYECKSIPDLRVFIEAQSARIEELKSSLGHARIQIDALNEQLMHGEEAVDLKDAAKGYLVCAPKRKPAKLMKAESAVARAKSAAKATGRCEVFALVPVGIATRKQIAAVEFKERAA